MDIQPSEISAILKREIRDFGAEAQVSEVGQVLSVGDGIARVYGLDNVQAGEMVEFPGAIKGMALNLETDNVGVVIFGEDRSIKRRRHGQTHRRNRGLSRLARGCCRASWTRWVSRLTAKGRSPAQPNAAAWTSRRPESFRANR